MKKMEMNRIKLNRETVRRLETSDLHGVAAGVSLAGCDTWTCATTHCHSCV